MGEFGKLNFSVGFKKTSAFPLDVDSYFTSLEEAQQAASTAVEPGSSDSVYYIGQTLTVVENGSTASYNIQPDKTLKPIGTINNVEVSIDDQVGTPSVTAELINQVLKLAFSNIKGERGDQIETAEVNVDNKVGTPSCEAIVENNTKLILNFKNLKGETGLKGDSGVSLGEVSLVQDFSTEEGSEDKVISQKAITQKFEDVLGRMVVLSEQEYEELPIKDDDKFYYIYEE